MPPKGESRQAGRLVARTWKLAPHPDLATVYAFAKPGESPRERLRRVEHLASLTPGDIEGPIAIAVAAIEARDWQRAGGRDLPYLHDRPPARILRFDGAHPEAGEGNRGASASGFAPCADPATGPGSPTATSPTAGSRSRRSLAPSTPSNGRRRSAHIGRGDETLLIEESHEPAAGATGDAEGRRLREGDA